MGRHNTISHDDQANPSMTGGFTKNPLSRRGPNGGFLNQTADDPRGMRSTGYTQQDIQEARNGLKLLKNKMDNLSRKGNSQNANRDGKPPF